MVSKKHPASGIVTLPDAIRTAVNALGQDTAFILTTAYATVLTRDFLCKKIRTQLRFEDGGRQDTFIIGFCRGDMTVAQILSALVTELPDPERYTDWQNYAELNGVFWETLKMITGEDITGQDASSVLSSWNDTISLGGGKGIPFEAGHGVQMFIFNASGQTAASGSVVGTYQMVGVFMEGSN